MPLTNQSESFSRAGFDLQYQICSQSLFKTCMLPFFSIQNTVACDVMLMRLDGVGPYLRKLTLHLLLPAETK